MKIIAEYYDSETDKKETKECINYRINGHNQFEFVPDRGNVFGSVVIDKATFNIYGDNENTVILVEGYQYITSAKGYWKTQTTIIIKN